MLQSRSARIATAVILLVAAVTSYFAMNRSTPLPGAGQAAEIILPDTRERIPMEWSAVFRMKPLLNPGNGAWMVNYPQGTETWSYVVNKGAPDPTPARSQEATATSP